MKYYAVIDTNIVISSMLKPESNPGQIINYVSMGVIVPILNDEILQEYEDVMSRNDFGFKKEEIYKTMVLFNERSIKLDRTKTIEEFADESDIVFYEVVLTAKRTIDAFLVTGNIRHFPNKSFVVTPKEMIDIIENDWLWVFKVMIPKYIDIYKIV